MLNTITEDDFFDFGGLAVRWKINGTTTSAHGRQKAAPSIKRFEAGYREIRFPFNSDFRVGLSVTFI
jgi:hypothetical protein